MITAKRRKEAAAAKENFKSLIIVNGKVCRSSLMKMAWERARRTFKTNAFNAFSSIKEAFTEALRYMWSCVKTA